MAYAGFGDSLVDFAHRQPFI